MEHPVNVAIIYHDMVHRNAASVHFVADNYCDAVHP